MAALHIINPFGNASGGSERRALELARVLQPHTAVTLWANARPDPALAAAFPIRAIDPSRLRFPFTGVFVFVGVYYWPTRWISIARPSRRIVIYNTHKLADLHVFLKRVGRGDPASCDIVFASDALKAASGLPGTVEESPIDITQFHPGSKPPGPFTIGRLSRDTSDKFHPDDAAFLSALACHGDRVRIMGGTVLRSGIVAGAVELLPACAETSVDFLTSLDCFYYRTHPDWQEAFGRVVFEAMACGIPVVCEARGGYATHIRSGDNGFLFETEGQAAEQLAALRVDPALRARIGAAGRRTVEVMYGAEYQARLRQFYLRPGP